MEGKNIFNDKAVKPNDQLLKDNLGKSYGFWEEIKNFIKSEIGETVGEWKYYNIKASPGWTLKMLLKKRNLFFLSVQEKSLRMAFVFGDKAVMVIEKSKLPRKIIDEIINATKYAEGRGLRINVKSEKDVKVITELIKIKVNN